jgi:hypothetical protein
MTNIITAFNKHFFEFVEDVHNAFPDSKDVLITKNTFLTAKKTNPKLILKIWKIYVVEKYRKEIELGNIDFFINKDYANDVSKLSYSDKVTQAIDRLRDPIKEMDLENQSKAMKYMQNLMKISDLCEI